MLKLNHFGNGVNLENLYNTVKAIACRERTFKAAPVVNNSFFYGLILL